jgi:hypothetical protein
VVKLLVTYTEEWVTAASGHRHGGLHQLSPLSLEALCEWMRVALLPLAAARITHDDVLAAVQSRPRVLAHWRELNVDTLAALLARGLRWTPAEELDFGTRLYHAMVLSR